MTGWTMKRVLCLAAALPLALPSVGSGAPARVVDRTFVCTPSALYGGVGDLDLISSPRDGPLLRGTVRAISTGYIGIGSGADAQASDLVTVRARTQERYQQEPQAPGVYMNARRCTRARSAIPLRPQGLPGPPVRFGSAPACPIRGRVLIRVRASLESPTSWLPSAPPYAGVRKNVVEATLAVRSERTRKPIGFIQLARSGTTKLWAAPGCGG
jgi:hypothetical protein